MTHVAAFARARAPLPERAAVRVYAAPTMARFSKAYLEPVPAVPNRSFGRDYARVDGVGVKDSRGHIFGLITVQGSVRSTLAKWARELSDAAGRRLGWTPNGGFNPRPDPA